MCLIRAGVKVTCQQVRLTPNTRSVTTCHTTGRGSYELLTSDFRSAWYGKTTRLLDLLCAEVEQQKTPLSEIAFVTFGRLAKKEVVTRLHKESFFLKLSEVDQALVWFRTIHSTAFKVLGLNRKLVMTNEVWQRFAEEYRYSFTTSSNMKGDEAFRSLPGAKQHDRARAALDWGRNRLVDFAHLSHHGHVVRDTFGDVINYRQVPPKVSGEGCRYGYDLDSHAVNLYHNLACFKARVETYDFTDMLEHALKTSDRPSVRVAFIDEAQDLSPLQVAVVEHWFADCARVYIAGDDDQAIYGFQGATPEWLVSLNDRADKCEILKQSHRVPKTVHRFAQAIIRGNRHRVAKEYASRDEEGVIEKLTQQQIYKRIPSWEEQHSSIMILFRNNWFLNNWASDLRADGTVFRYGRSGNLSSFRDPLAPQAVQVGLDLLAGRIVQADDFRVWVAWLQRPDIHTPELVTFAAKNRSGLRLYEETVLLTGREEYGTYSQLRSGRDLIKALRAHGPIDILARLKASEVKGAKQMVARYGSCLDGPKVELSTIHGAKGREADLVVLVPNLTKTTWLSLKKWCTEEENRIAYVAATRVVNTWSWPMSRQTSVISTPTLVCSESVH